MSCSDYCASVTHTPTVYLCSILKLTGEDRRWMETALMVSIHYGLLDLLQYLVDTVGVTLTGELY